jgi:hypothetical protein
MSAIGWVDFSSEHRERVKTVIDLLSVPGVIDELGIGAIRDSFSDYLFPGLSTVQTRAKYLITVPRIFSDYAQLSNQEKRRRKLREYLREQENLCMKSMVKNHASDPQSGIIGESFANKKGEVQRKPSSTYWTGLRRFKLIRTNLSLQAFCNRFANPDASLHDLIRGSDKNQGDDLDAAEHLPNQISTPIYEPDWIDRLKITLNPQEANFLAQKIGSSVPESLLGQIVLDERIRKTFLDCSSNNSFSRLANHTAFMNQLPIHLQNVIRVARDFWKLMYGAHIRYNCLIQDKVGIKELSQEFRDEWEAWIDNLSAFDWDNWNTDELWMLTNRHQGFVKDQTVEFITNWIDSVRKSAPIGQLDNLVIRQERLNKGSKSRLRSNADVKETTWVGINNLNYRLGTARAIVEDIHVGLTSSETIDA